MFHKEHVCISLILTGTSIILILGNTISDWFPRLLFWVYCSIGYVLGMEPEPPDLRTVI